MACIFIVENHTWVREGLSELLSRETGVEVCGTAASAEEALKALPANADVVIVDIGMDGMSGLDLVREIRERWPELITLILTNYPAETHRDAAMEAGAVGFIEKGDAPRLLEAVNRALADAGRSADKAA